MTTGGKDAVERGVNILIAGLAKTGTTILFARTLASLPCKSRTFFEPRSAAELDAILSNGEGYTTLTKALIPNVTAQHVQVKRFSHVVLIARDPRDQFVSEMLYEFYNFQQSGDLNAFRGARRQLARKVKSPSSIAARDLFEAIHARVIGRRMRNSPISLLRDKYSDLARFRDAFAPFVVRYEDIVDNRLSDLAAYLGLSAISPAEVDRSFGHVARTKSYGNWRDWLTESDLEEFRVELGGLMQEFGYELVPQPTVQTIARETSLDYVDQFRPRWSQWLRFAMSERRARNPRGGAA